MKKQSFGIILAAVLGAGSLFSAVIPGTDALFTTALPGTGAVTVQAEASNSFGGSGNEEDNSSQDYAASEFSLVLDEADLLTDEEESQLLDKLEAITGEYNLEVAVATVESKDGNEMNYFTDHFFDENGYGTGENKCMEAVQQAITSPLLETSVDGATNFILNFSGGDIGIQETNEAAEYVRELAGEDANIIFGIMLDDNDDNDGVTITIIATGLKDETAQASSFGGFGSTFSNGSLGGKMNLGHTAAPHVAKPTPMSQPSFLSGFNSAARKSQPSAATVNQDMPVVNHKINRTPQQVSPTMKKEDDSIKIPEFIQNYRKKED